MVQKVCRWLRKAGDEGVSKDNGSWQWSVPLSVKPLAHMEARDGAQGAEGADRVRRVCRNPIHLTLHLLEGCSTGSPNSWLSVFPAENVSLQSTERHSAQARVCGRGESAATFLPSLDGHLDGPCDDRQPLVSSTCRRDVNATWDYRRLQEATGGSDWILSGLKGGIKASCRLIFLGMGGSSLPLH